MYQLSKIKKAKTFYNKFITAQKRSSINIKVELLKDSLIHTIQFDKLGIRVLIKGDSQNLDFNPLNLNFDEWYQTIDLNQKNGVKETSIEIVNGHFSMGGERILSTPTKSGHVDWQELCSFNMEAFNNAFNINNVCANNGKLDCNNQIFFCLQDNMLKLLNTNEIILQESTILDVTLNSTLIFSIENSYTSNMKKYFLFANNNCMDISIFKFGNFIKFVCESDDENIYEMIVPIKEDKNITNIYNSLNKLINNKWVGTKVELNENDMYQVAVEEAVNTLLTSGKKVSKKAIKTSLDTFTKSEDKVAAFKKLDKSIDVPFLSLSNSLNEDNLYILRTLYTNYISSISEFDYIIYFLNTNAKTLLFGYKDEMFSFKTLFMLRKPREIVESISDEDIKLEEDEIIDNVDYDVFEPT